MPDARTERLLGAYAKAYVRRRHIMTLANACFDGFWLGMLDKAQLDRLDERFYSEGADVEDGRAFSYRDEQHNLHGLRSWEQVALDAHFRSGSRVIVTGAGGGREVIALLERGFDAVGYEPNERLVQAGRDLLMRLGHRERLHGCARDAFPQTDGLWDGVLVGWGSYMLIPGCHRRVAFLRAARRVLPEGAPLMCSFFLRDAGSRYHAALAGTANVVRRMRRRERVEEGDGLRENFVHSFTRREIERELELGGFRMVLFQAQPYGHAVALAAPDRSS